MQHTALEGTDIQQGILANEACRRASGNAVLLDNTARILAELIPLKHGSHADVVEYRVEIPMRYAECHAILADGSRVAFRNPRRFLGWSSHDARRSLRFRNNDITLEVEVDNNAGTCERQTVRSISLQAAVRNGASRLKK